MSTKIYLVDDHEMLRDGLKLIAAKHPDLEIVGEAATVAAATKDFAHLLAIDVLLSDFRLTDGDGLPLIPPFRKRFPDGKVIILSGSTTRSLVRACLIAGANGFVSKDDGAVEIVRALRVVQSGETFLSTRAASVIAEEMKHVDLSPIATLSRQEIAVLRGIAIGQTYKEIGLTLGIGTKSVETYRARLSRKNGLRTKAQLARFAATNDVVA